MQKLYSYLWVCVALLCAQNLQAQQVTHGPVSGGVTHNSARVYVRTSQATAITVEYSRDNFATIDQTVTGNTVATRDSSNILSVTGLTPNSEYLVRVRINGTQSGETGRFKTPPAPGDAGEFVFLGGSCIGSLTDRDTALFKRMEAEDANLIMYYGDWGYPDNDNDALCLTYPFTCFQFNRQPSSYAADMRLIEEAYRNRYGSPNSGFLTTKTALVYTYDDHDYLNDNSGANFAGGYYINSAFQPYAPSGFSQLGRPLSIPQPASARANIIKAYAQYFPTYDLPDTSKGIYHKFTYGNCEFFVLDTRASRGAQQEKIKPAASGTSWILDDSDPAHQSILGADQMNWLMDGLRNSTADWKFIITSVTFNPANQAAFDSVLSAGSASVPLLGDQLSGLPIQPTGYIIASRYADKWVGYPTDMQMLIDSIVSPADATKRIPNVFLVSGDTHNSALDDGTHSAIPELMAGQLKRSNRREARESQDFLGYNIWNKGGTLLCTNDNASSNYGKIHVFGRDSVRLSAWDSRGNEIFGYTFQKDAPYRYNPNFTPNYQPIPQNDTYQTNDTTAITFSPLENDVDPENDPMFVVLKELPQSGVLDFDPNTNTFTYTPDQPGNYAFLYKACDNANPDCPSCKEATVFIEVLSTTVSRNGSLSAVTGFSVYPNPVSSTLHIDPVAKNDNRPYTLHLMNNLGQVLRVQTFTGSTTLDMRTLPGGYYLYRIVDANQRQHKAGTITVTHY